MHTLVQTLVLLYAIERAPPADPLSLHLLNAAVDRENELQTVDDDGPNGKRRTSFAGILQH